MTVPRQLSSTDTKVVVSACRRRMLVRAGVVLVAVAFVCTFAPRARSQSIMFSRDQNVAPSFEGWQAKADGTFDLVFGYLNRNLDEELDIPIGPDNNVEPGGPDRAQPTHFLPRRNRYVFRVNVPKNFGAQEVVWTLTSKGKTEKAYGIAEARLRHRHPADHERRRRLGCAKNRT